LAIEKLANDTLKVLIVKLKKADGVRRPGCFSGRDGKSHGVCILLLEIWLRECSVAE